MIFSIFDHNARCFDYYEAPGTSKTYGSRGTKYRAPTQPPQGSPQLGGIGYAPEALALPLPAGARQVGRGTQARGVIAVKAVRAQAAQSTVSGLGASGLGANEVVVEETVRQHQSFKHTLAAACVAAVVGVLVQRMLR
jgi:hypothetical protein